MRRKYLDNLRSFVIILVFLFHIVFFFNPMLYTEANCYSVDSVYYLYQQLVYPWFMLLLFTLSGIVSKCSLEKRTEREFVKERARKTLFPSCVAVLILGWLPGSMAIKLSAADLSQAPTPVKFIIYTMSGIQGLWFLQVLFIASLMLILVRKIDKNRRFEAFCEKSGLVVFLLFFAISWLSGFVLNGKVVVSYRMGYYIVAYLSGYYLFSSEMAAETLEKYRFIFLAPAALGFALSFKASKEAYYGSIEVLTRADVSLYAYFFSLYALGFARKWMNGEDKFTTFWNRYSFPFYIFHIPVLLLINTVIEQCLNVNFSLRALIMLFLAPPLTILLSYLTRKFKVTRLIFLGEK